MLMNHADIAPARFSAVLEAAEAAGRAIPPAFPLDATVAVNPFLGQTHEDLATAAARLARVAGVRATRKGGEYCDAIASGTITETDLADALAASPSPLKPADTAMLRHGAARIGNGPPPRALPTVADLAAEATGIDWPALIDKCIGLWAAGHFDRGQALWSPAPGAEAFTAWRGWAMHDLTPEIAGLEGFCAHVACAPDTTERAILSAAETLGITDAAAPTAFHRLAMSLGGWAQHARWILWQAELVGDTDRTLMDLLAIRLIWDEALLVQTPAIADKWAATVAAHAAPVTPSEEEVVLAILQDAADRAHQRRLIAALDGAAPAAAARPFLQAAFCIDVRSEVFRRALESVDNSIATIGFAGFFGLPLAHHAHGSDILEARLPVLLNPAVHTTSAGDPAKDQADRIAARGARAWGRFRQAAVSSFAFVEAAGPVYAVKLVKSALGFVPKPKAEPAPEVIGGMSAEAKADTCAAVLKAMSLQKGHGAIVLLLGHGGNVTNNPHESAYHCGACGGYTGEVSARLLAILLNDPETRAGLAERGVEVAEDVLFVAGLHDTTTDAITIYDDGLPAARAGDLAKVRTWLAQAAKIARAERALRMPGASGNSIPARAQNWAEIRPEWGLAGCA
ncbi:MAG: putative inorganic carbon transporter subunit DabA, partial [Erythrobacter sp.]